MFDCLVERWRFFRVNAVTKGCINNHRDDRFGVILNKCHDGIV